MKCRLSLFADGARGGRHPDKVGAWSTVVLNPPDSPPGVVVTVVHLVTVYSDPF